MVLGFEKSNSNKKGKEEGMMPVIFDFSELRGRIIARYGSYANFAHAIGLSRAQLSERLRNKRPFKPDEITTICSPSVLNIPIELIGRYFFTPKV